MPHTPGFLCLDDPWMDVPTDYRKTQDWQFRVPSPPHITLPPPPMEYALAELDPGIDPYFSFPTDSNGFNNTAFLKAADYEELRRTSFHPEWKYDQRHFAQLILPFLYLGPVSAARDRHFLQREDITLIVAVRDQSSAQAKLLGSKAARDLGISCLNVDVNGYPDLITALPGAIDSINDHLSANYEKQQAQKPKSMYDAQNTLPSSFGKVLVFCETGNERSATVVAAYIMAMFAQDLVTTLQFVQCRRFCVAFDDSIRYLLRSYETILQAKRDIAWANTDRNDGNIHTLTGRSTKARNGELAAKPSKRLLNEVYENDVEMEDGDSQRDSGRFEGRGVVPPFEDDSEP